MLGKKGYARIVLEGTTADFESEVAEWFQDVEIEGAGNVVVLKVLDSDVGKLAERLRVGGPESLYRAILPPTCGKKRPEVILGSKFHSENKELEESKGRHMPLSLLPSELAKSRSRIKKRCCDYYPH